MQPLSWYSNHPDWGERSSSLTPSQPTFGNGGPATAQERKAGDLVATPQGDINPSVLGVEAPTKKTGIGRFGIKADGDASVISTDEGSAGSAQVQAARHDDDRPIGYSKP